MRCGDDRRDIGPDDPGRPGPHAVRPQVSRVLSPVFLQYFNGAIVIDTAWTIRYGPTYNPLSFPPTIQGVVCGPDARYSSYEEASFSRG